MPPPEMSPEIARELVVEARDAGKRPRLHPNGFVQLDLVSAPNARIHVWPQPALQAQATDNPIHDHKFDMRSTVIRGALGQVLHRPELEHFADPTHEIYTATYADPHDSTLMPTGVLVRVLEPRLFPVYAGDTYTQRATTFHDTIALGTEPVVTYMEKVFVFGQHEPRVLCPVGQDPDNDFKREAVDADTLWNAIDESLWF